MHLTTSHIPSVRRAQIGDEAAIHDLGLALWYRSPPPRAQPQTKQEQDYLDDVFMRYWDEDYLNHTIQDAQCAVVVAELVPKIVGLAVALPVSGEGAALLSRLDALPVCRDGGVLGDLLQMCERSVPHAVQCLRTCVPLAETEQIRFYEDRGYRQQRIFDLSNGLQLTRFVELAKRLPSAEREERGRTIQRKHFRH